LNNKITVENPHGERVFCILSSEQDYKKQMEQVVGVTPGYGMSLDIGTDVIRLVDYLHGEERARFTILSIEDTDAPVCLYWQKDE